MFPELTPIHVHSPWGQAATQVAAMLEDCINNGTSFDISRKQEDGPLRQVAVLLPYDEYHALIECIKEMSPPPPCDAVHPELPGARCTYLGPHETHLANTHNFGEVEW